MSSPEPARRLGATSAAALVVANMIGAGVFTTSGFALADLGSPARVLWAWAVGGLLALSGALSYGALSRRMPESGGEYLFLARTVHPLAGFLAGWVSLFAGFTAPTAAAALGLQAYLAPHTDFDARWLGTGAILLAGLMHGLRTKRGVVAQNLLVGAKLLALVAFLVLGFVRLRGAAGTAAEQLEAAAAGPADFEFGAFCVSLVWISFAYSGWNAAVYVAGEIRDPERNLVRALLGATGLVTLLYLGLNAVFVYSAPIDELAGREDVGAAAAAALGGERLAQALSLLVAAALFSSVSAMVMAGPRVYERMARDGLFPGLSRGGEKGLALAVWLQVALAVVVVWISGLRELLGYVGFVLGLSATATVLGLIRLRLREGRERVPVPGFPWVQLFFVGGTLGAAGYMAWREPAEAGAGLATVLAGLPVYFLVRGRADSVSRGSASRSG